MVLSIITKEKGTQTYVCSHFENVCGELLIYEDGDLLKSLGPGEWISYKEVKEMRG